MIISKPRFTAPAAKSALAQCITALIPWRCAISRILSQVFKCNGLVLSACGSKSSARISLPGQYRPHPIQVNLVSQKRNTCGGTSKSPATSLIVRKAAADLPARREFALLLMPWLPVSGALITLYFKADLIRSLSTCDGRKTKTRRGKIGTSSPVFGLRPTRWPFWRTEKLPNDEIFTISPRPSASVTSSKTDSTNSADSFRDRPTS